MSRVVHVVEPGGVGGIHQHALALAERLQDLGVNAVLHTAADAEAIPTRVTRQACFWRFPSVRPPVVRRILFVGGWLLRGVASCLYRVSPDDVVHIEGRFKPVLLVPLVLVAKARGCTVTFNPHTTFIRSGPASDEALLRWITRHSHATIVHCEPDEARIREWGARPVRMPLLVRRASREPDLVAWWRRRWGAEDGTPVVLLAGQLRSDKGVDVLVRAAASLEDKAIVALVGEDLGVAGEAKVLAAQLGVTLVVDDTYQPMDRFVAAVAAADVVACPYRRASQSAVLSMAASLGRPSVGTDVGGLAERATVVVPVDDPAAFAVAITHALHTTPTRPHHPDEDEIRPFLEAVRLPLPAWT